MIWALRQVVLERPYEVLAGRHLTHPQKIFRALRQALVLGCHRSATPGHAGIVTEIGKREEVSILSELFCLVAFVYLL